MTPGPSPTRRRVLAAAGTLLLPRAARAQATKRRRIAYLALGSRASSAPRLGAFREGLRALGYGDDDIAIEIRYADGHAERLPDLAAELARLAPEIIVAEASPAITAARQATSTIAIVMMGAPDPIGTGFVASLAHPGGNVTGLSTQGKDLAGKWVELLRTAIPDARRIAVLRNPGNPGHDVILQGAQQAARTLRIELLSIDARTPDEIDGAFGAMIREHADAVVVPGDPFFGLEGSRIVELAARHKLAAINPFREFAAIGGLMSFGTDLNDLDRRAAAYVDKILKGAKPADLPVEQPTKFELVVNLKTAQALGLTIPPVILAGADEVIE
jgi:putative tryptophan/tyrosine transport system substrate-binding protein